MLESLKDLYIAYPFLPVSVIPEFFQQVKDVRLVVELPAADLILGYKNGCYVRAWLTGFSSGCANLRIRCSQIRDEDIERTVELYSSELEVPPTQSFMLCDQALIDNPPELSTIYELNPDVLTIVQKAPRLYVGEEPVPALVNIERGYNVGVSLYNGNVALYGAPGAGKGLYAYSDLPGSRKPVQTAKGALSINGIAGSVDISGTYPVKVELPVGGSTLSVTRETGVGVETSGGIMPRIPEAGCGWRYTDVTVGGSTRSYSCSGLVKLDVVFGTTSVSGNTAIIPGGTNTFVYDHFDWLPQHIEGFRMTLSPIIDMSGTTNGEHLEVPELACRTDFNPFDDLVTGSTPSYILNPSITGNTATAFSGYLDLYNQIPSYHDQFYVTVGGATAHMTTDTAYPVYIVGNTTLEMGPGILEPMLNTQFGPVAIDMPTTPDLTTDAIIYSLAGLQSWRHKLDSMVSNLNINSFNFGLQGLEVAKNLESPCNNFQIKVASGLPLAPVSSFTSSSTLIPKYDITGGVINVNGTQVAVGGSTESWTAPFQAYLEISSDYTNHTYSGALMSAVGAYTPADRDHVAVYIGAVTSVSNAFTSGSTISQLVSKYLGTGEQYTEYRIHQGDCITDVELITGDTNGYLYMTKVNGGRQYITDPLLDNMENLDGVGYRGVQASAIAAYVSAHGGTAGIASYDGPFKTTLEDGVLSIFDGSNDTAVAGYAFINGQYHVPVYTYRTAIVDTSPQDIYLMAYKHDPGSDSAQVSAIYWQGDKYDIDGTTQDHYKWTAYKGEAQERSIYTTTSTPTAGTEVYSLVDNVFVMLGYISDPMGDLAFRYQVGGTGYIGVEDIWLTRIAHISGGSVEQIQYGDVQVDTTQGAADTYTGPWSVAVRDGTYYVTCKGCGKDNHNSSIVGFYRMNGQTESSLAGDVQGPAVNGAVYLHISAGGAEVNTTADPADPAVYTVRLANITTATAYQLHFGNVYVDGRWQ